MVSRLKLDRAQLAKFLPSHEAIKAFEDVFSFTSEAPATLEEVTALAAMAVSAANQALSMLAIYSEQMEQLVAMANNPPVLELDNFAPASTPTTLGTLSEQDANAVDITGGAINNTTVGATVASTGAFTTLSASGAVALSPANAAVVLAPTGTGVVTIAPATLGSMDRVAIGGTTPAAAAVTTLTASAAVTLSPANAAVTFAPTGTGTVTIFPATAGAMNRVAIGATVASSGAFTTLSASAAVALSPANANVVLSPTGTGAVTIFPATAGSIDRMNIGATTQGTVKGTTVTATSSLTTGVTGTAGLVRLARAFDGAIAATITVNGTAEMVIDHAAGDVVVMYGSAEKIRAHATGCTVTGSMKATTGFGCNGAAVQTSAASGGALAGYVAGANGLDSGANMSALHALVVSIRAALVANGIMS